MRKTFIGFAAGLTALPLAAAAASQNCAARELVVDRLESGYGEAFAGGGLQDSTRILEVWASEEEGTWTILMTRADGTSCVVASGTDWREGLPEERVSGVPG